MMVDRTNAGPGLPAGFAFSFAASAGGLTFVSGMPALDETGAFAPGTFEQETERVWANVMAIVRAAGCDQADLVFVQVLLADIEDYAALNAWWRQQFPELAQAPARLTFQAGALPFGAKIEMQAVAATPAG
jgi:2-iminobutanoate/2-iminopropanoate deaminase